MEESYQIISNPLSQKRLLPALINFLNSQDLEYDDNIEYSINILDREDNIIATGSLDKNIIKCLAVKSEYRNEGYSAKIVSKLITHANETGIRKLFVFTKLGNEKMFKDLGFYTIEKTNKILLMENEKSGFNNYLKKIKFESAIFIKKNKIIPKKIGCIIANCNPFTLGHLYLINEASKQCDILHVFILSGSNKFFNEEERLMLVKQGISSFSNVIVHRSKEYILSPLTFPTYFIKDKIQTTKINCELDIKIFLNHIVPLLNINQRFLGTEPKDLVTHSYNNELIKALSNSDVKLSIINRKLSEDTIISASTVRKYIKNKQFEKIKLLVPDTTYEFILNKFS